MGNSHPHVYDHGAAIESRSWRAYVPEGVRPYIESAPLAALFLGISSGAAYAMIGATLTSRLAQVGISIGTATFNTDGETLDQLIAAADSEMYKVKSLHKVAQTGPSEGQPAPEVRVNRMTATG